MLLTQIEVLSLRWFCPGVQIFCTNSWTRAGLFLPRWSLHGIRITPFVSPWYTTTNIESNPSYNGRSVIRSIEKLANGRVDVAPSTGKNAGFDGLRSILNCWQTPHLLKRRTDAESNARKTDGTDGSELWNTLKGMEHGKGAEVRNEVRKKGEYGTYNVGVKDLASAYVLCPRLAECGGLSIFGRGKGLRNNEGIRKSRVVTQVRGQIRTEY